MRLRLLVVLLLSGCGTGSPGDDVGPTQITIVNTTADRGNVHFYYAGGRGEFAVEPLRDYTKITITTPPDTCDRQMSLLFSVDDGWHEAETVAPGCGGHLQCTTVTHPSEIAPGCQRHLLRWQCNMSCKPI